MDLKSYIQIVPNALDKKICLDIVENKKYKYAQAKILGDNSKGRTDTEIRNCSSTPVLDKDDGIVFQSIGRIIANYIDKTKCVLPENINDSGYEILKYETGGFYKKHTDDVMGTPRRIAISILLNEEYQGGEFQFFEDYKVQGGTGTAIAFPANYCYPHEVLPILEGTRYSIITWVS